MSESRHEPIAIVGIGCRFPGRADSPAAFWDLLKDGTDAIVEVPKDRWNVDEFYDPHPETPGKMYVRAGGFLREKIDEFDATFFGMSPREASYLDPQQRLLLEVAWEAMEDAGLVVEQLAGSKTRVYIGAFMLDNLLTQLSPLNRNSIGAHSQLGATMNNLANRLSYVFDFRGPSTTMDTACSSSLVAFHQACQALWHRECSLALAGGVNVMLRPEGPIAGCKGGFLAPDGRCKSFDARADGYGRGEGAGIVILKPLLAALQDGDEIYALVRATGVNQDGRTNGITAPNPDAQEALVRQVCADGEVSPSQIRYIEAHGTGTALGDPIEAAALGAATGRYRAPDDPCVVGSVKANIGHLEAAAGVAGIIKASLCLKHNSVPPVANLETPNPKIAFAELACGCRAARSRCWPPRMRLRRDQLVRLWRHQCPRHPAASDAVGRAGCRERPRRACVDVGEVLAEIRGLQAKVLTKKERDDLKDLDQWLYQFVWQSAPQEQSEGGGNWLIFMDRNGVGERLVAELETAGAAHIIRVLPAATFRRKGACDYRIRPNEKRDMRRLLADAISGGLRGVVYLWGLDSGEADDAVGIAKVVSGLNLIQSLGEQQAADPARVAFVTCQAQAVDPRRYELSLAQVPLVGLVRAAISERPELRLRLIDIDAGAGTLSCLAGEILSISAEEEIALRGADRYVHRLVRKPAQGMTAEAAENPWPAQGDSPPIADRSESAAGASGRRGGQDSPSGELATEEVEVELRFAPVGWGVVPAGALPADPVVAGNIATWVGPEAAGTVTRIGTRVDKLQVGDDVLVDLQGETGPRVARPQRHVFRLSGRGGAIGKDHDALLPTFVSAYYAVHHVARLQKGERVLVHGAANPLGLAAIQVARWLEAALYVTAADAEEGAHLRALGVEHVFDCASLEFVDRIVEHSEGRRIDVVFNMLPGEIAAKTFALLAPFGRFVNMQRGRQPVARVPLQPNQCVTDVDVRHVMRDRPELFGQLLAEVLARFDTEDLSPLPRQIFGAAESVNTAGAPAYSQPFTAVVRSFDGVQPGASSSELMPKGQVRADGTYLITGGFGGFGLELAKWLTSQGARHLALVGRRGAGSAQAQQTIEKLRRGGVRVLTIAADIAEESGVRRVMAEIASAAPPLRGVFHTAAVLDDALIQHLAPRQVENVMRPKALGAWHLHRHTLDAPLDQFVLFSSIGSLLGSPGQATYVAANAFLDALAHFRRSRDLPALSINWGALAQVGMAADHPEAEQYLGSVGMGFFTPRQAMKILRQVLEWNPVELCTAIMDWSVWGATYPAWIASARFRHLLTAEDRAAAGEHGTSAGAQEFNPEERKTMVAAILVESLAAVLRMAPEKLDHTQSLFSMGVDSMMAMELHGAIEKKIGVKLSALELMNGNSFAQLIQQVGRLATEKAHAAITVTATSPTAASIGRNGRPHAGNLQELLDLADLGQTAALLQNLSDEEVAQALDQLQAMPETAL